MLVTLSAWGAQNLCRRPLFLGSVDHATYAVNLRDEVTFGAGSSSFFVTNERDGLHPGESQG